jgi:hypothetical protein
MNPKLSPILSWAGVIFIVLLSLFTIYQILRIVFGGSWSTEDSILVGVGLNFTATLGMFSYLLSLQKTISMNTSNIAHLQRSFNALASDFKEHRKEFHDFKLEMLTFKSDTNHKFKEVNQRLSRIESKLDKK